jgi:hypothetical protein
MKEIVISINVRLENESELPDLMCEVIERFSNGYSSGSFRSVNGVLVDFDKDTTED